MDTPFIEISSRSFVMTGHRHGLAIDLYYSHPDWYDADFPPLTDSIPLIFPMPWSTRLMVRMELKKEKNIKAGCLKILPFRPPRKRTA